MAAFKSYFMKKPKKPVKKSISLLRKNLKTVLHQYIRQRDMQNGYGICISCQKNYPYEQLQAGHYIKAGNYARVRYEEDNINAQCGFSCNMQKGGNVVEYRINLVKKIGEDRVLRLENMRHDPFKPTREWYEEKIETYKNLLK